MGGLTPGAGPLPVHVVRDEDVSNSVIIYTNRLLAETREEIGRADQKASILLSSTGVGVALLFGLLTGDWSPAELAVAVQWLWWLGAIAMAAAITLLASAVMPRIRHPGDPSTVTFFGHVVRLNDRSRLIEHLTRSAAMPLDRAVDQLVMLSGIAFQKYRRTQLAIWLLAGAALSTCASVGVSALLR